MSGALGLAAAPTPTPGGSVEVELARLDERLSAHIKHDEERHDTLMARIDKLEQRLWVIATGASLVSAGGGAVLSHFFGG